MESVLINIINVKYNNFQAMPRSAFLTISFQMGLEEGGAIENSQ